MEILIKILISLGLIIGGVISLTHSYQLTQLFGHNDWAERYLGDGGTYSMWKIIGVLLCIGSLVYLIS